MEDIPWTCFLINVQIPVTQAQPRLVPPAFVQPPRDEIYTATPGRWSAEKAMSGKERIFSSGGTKFF